MTVGELLDALQGLHIDRRAEIRIGEQVEGGPYLHASVGGVWIGNEGDIIICANDDEVWKDEYAMNPEKELQVLWAPQTTEEKNPPHDGTEDLSHLFDESD